MTPQDRADADARITLRLRELSDAQDNANELFASALAAANYGHLDTLLDSDASAWLAKYSPQTSAAIGSEPDRSEAGAPQPGAEQPEALLPSPAPDELTALAATLADQVLHPATTRADVLLLLEVALRDQRIAGVAEVRTLIAERLDARRVKP